MGWRVLLCAGLAGAGAFHRCHHAAELVDPPQQRGEHCELVLPGAAMHRLVRLALVRRLFFEHCNLGHGAGSLGRLPGAQIGGNSCSTVKEPYPTRYEPERSWIWGMNQAAGLDRRWNKSNSLSRATFMALAAPKSVRALALS